ncbi:hypothetical protein SBOR_5680 [Sclerotinia borealis F-4128]|uniref:Uncharacterized protein n=1 Tax=Sclerotinia borealis (strain F-4128) TaxID=1432307 RepID=W9CDI2_SCLBF|nr:hypothetical protein SBOR_5680 [Sclerotinia borealis F-4128]
MSTSSRFDAPRRVQFGASITNTPREDTKAIRNPANEQYYHRMVELEKRIWTKANVKTQIEADVSDKEPQVVQHRVRFGNCFTNPPCKDLKEPKVAKRNANKQYYDRMVRLEAKMWLEGKDQAESETDEWSEGNSPVGTRYDTLRSRPKTSIDEKYSAHAAELADISIQFSKIHIEITQDTTK